MASIFKVGDDGALVRVGGATFDVLLEWLRHSATDGLIAGDRLFESRLSGADIGVFDLSNVKESTELRLVDLLDAITSPNHQFWARWVKRPEYAVGYADQVRSGQSEEDSISSFTKSYRDEVETLANALRGAIDRRRKWRASLSSKARLLEYLKIMERDLFIDQAAEAGVQLGDTQQVYRWARSIGYEKRVPFLNT